MLSSSSSGKDESLEFLTSSTVRVDTSELFANALEDLYSYNRFAFDTEGVNLGRSGDLTIATIQGIPSSGVFLAWIFRKPLLKSMLLMYNC